MPTFPYANLFIGLLWVYRTPSRTSRHGKFLGGRIDCQLAYSYDGWHFQRGPREPFIANADPGRIGAGCILPCSLLATESEIRLYCCASAQEHAVFGEESPRRSAILMHRLRPDGFVCLEAASGQGRLKTRALLVQGGRLSFNVQAPGGQLLVGVSDADGKPIPGYGLGSPMERRRPFRESQGSCRATGAAARRRAALCRERRLSEAFARKRIEVDAGRAGWVCGTQYAEGFVRRAPDLFDELPAPDRALQKARGKRMDQLRRMSGELPGPSKS